MDRQVDKSYSPLLPALIFAAAIGIFLWCISGLPPYGTPFNEVSDFYWGIAANIAHQIRLGHIDFWTRSVGGGACLFSSGCYPLLNPSNIAALLLNDDQFLLLKLIEPFMVGGFFCFLLFRSVFKLPVYLAVSASLFYLGYIFARHSVIHIHLPIFLFGGALLPGFVYCAFGSPHLSFQSRSCLIGTLLAMQFFWGGVAQLPQTTIFIMVMLTVQQLATDRPFGQRTKNAFMACGITLFFFALIASPQLLPTIIYLLQDSNRCPGQYSINNLPWFAPGHETNKSIMLLLKESYFTPGGLSSRSFWPLALAGLVPFLNPLLRRRFKQWQQDQPCLRQLAICGLIFFLIPPTASLTAALIPSSARLFAPLTTFTFAYYTCLIDLILVACMANFLGLADSGAGDTTTPKHLRWLKVCLVLLAGLSITAPLIAWFLAKFIPSLPSIRPIFSLAPSSLANAAFIALLTIWCLIYLLTDWHKHRWARRSYIVALVTLGLLTMVTGYKWGDKGQSGDVSLFHFDTPEYKFYSKAAGLFYLPYNNNVFETMRHNYNLLFDVNGLEGYMPVPSRRINNFMNHFHSKKYLLPFTSGQKYSIYPTPASLTTHWSVDFTAIDHGEKLPWDGFKKEVDGKFLDIWVNQTPQRQIRLAHTLIVTDLDHVIAWYDQPWRPVIYVDKKDAAQYKLTASSIPDPDNAAAISQLVRQKNGISFKVVNRQAAWIITNEMFQQGWHAYIDGKPAAVFPADHLMVGLYVPAGPHDVQLKYQPPLLYPGMFLCALGLMLLVIIFLIKSPE